MQNMLLVVAHPDDETIGASSVLAGVSALIHVTDGAPRDMADAARHGFATCEAYAAARSAELARALNVAGVSPQRFSLGIPDQEASHAIPQTVVQLRKLIGMVRPALILTHAYEGGHPDHDACSLAVRLAAGGLPVYEFAGYHIADGQIRTGEFRAVPQDVRTVLLDARQLKRKLRMFECFGTQRDVLRYFTTAHERFRKAPEYDYTKPPHDGLLFYEQFPWGMTGARFCSLAAQAVRTC